MTETVEKGLGRSLWARAGWALWAVVFAALAVGCSDDGNGGSGATTADTQGGDASGDATEEVINIGDDLAGGEDATNGGVDPTLAAAWPYNRGVSGGAVTVTTAGGVSSAEIDAAAGGFGESSKQAFVYLDLDAGEKVAIDDFDAAANRAWDLAFKRSAIRTNGADGGPGNIQIARLTDTTFEAVTEVPNGLIFAQDVSFDVDNNLLTDPIGAPKTAFNYVNPDTSSGSWYDYTNGVSVIPGHIYIIQDSAAGTSFKFEILSWTSGVYQVRWAQL